jgi:RES domain-containing protein
MIVYRISDHRYINDLSGTGAALYGGRWNSKNVYIVYTAQSPSLALLETVVHMGGMPPANYSLATIELPDSLAPALAEGILQPDWYISPPPEALKLIGDEFVQKMKYLILPVPSAIMPEEHNYLVNPRHRLAGKIKVLSVKSVRMDGRLRKQL